MFAVFEDTFLSFQVTFPIPTAETSKVNFCDVSAEELSQDWYVSPYSAAGSCLDNY